MSQPLPLAGAILAGGESRRMGRPKEGVRLPDGRVMIEAVADALRPHCELIVVVGACSGWAVPQSAEWIHLPDKEPGLGPLGGIATLLASGVAQRYLVASCDQPFLTAYLVAPLAASQRAAFLKTKSGEELDPFPGLYPAEWEKAVRAAVEARELGVRRFLRGQSFEWIVVSDAASGSVRSVNAPGDL